MTYVRLWLDDHRLGCGERGFFVVQRGPKWVTLFYPPRSITTKVDTKQFDRYAKEERYQKVKMRALIREVAARNTEDGKRPKLSNAARQVLQQMKSPRS